MVDEVTVAYQGLELSIFASAVNWKRYWSSSIRQWIRGDVLEVGAGLGANTRLLQTEAVRSWSCLEPDASLCEHLREVVADMDGCSVRCGTLASVSGRQLDCILYIDVLEHIEADRAELARAAGLLRPGGHLIVLSPAYPFLFSPFDAAIGHYRRYNRSSLLACSPPGCRAEKILYLDFFGVALSLANRLLLRQTIPSEDQLSIWDTWVIPASRICDRMIRYRAGKSIVGVWTRLSASDEERQAR